MRLGAEDSVEVDRHGDVAGGRGWGRRESGGGGGGERVGVGGVVGGGEELEVGEEAVGPFGGGGGEVVGSGGAVAEGGELVGLSAGGGGWWWEETRSRDADAQSFHRCFRNA